MEGNHAEEKRREEEYYYTMGNTQTMGMRPYYRVHMHGRLLY